MSKKKSVSSFNLSFGQEGDATPYLLSGWSWPEPGRVWMTGDQSVLRLPPLPMSGPVICDLLVAPFVKRPYRALQRLEISINGGKVGAFRIDRHRFIRFLIAANMLSKTEENEFSFVHPDHLRPEDVSVSRDFRELSISVNHLILQEADGQPPDVSSIDGTWRFAWGTPKDHPPPNAGLGCGWTGTGVPGQADLSFSGEQSDILLPPLPPNASGSLSLKVRPYILEPYRSVQRLRVLLNDTEIGRRDLATTHEFKIEIPAGLLIENRQNSLVFEHPDFLVPHDILGNADHRKISGFVDRIEIDLKLQDAFDASHTLSMTDLFNRFESLGNNCELGLVQRRAGAEPLGLFRWSSTSVSSIILALDNDFKNLGEEDDVLIELAENEHGPREYMIREKKYGLFFHSWQFEGQVEPDILKAREIIKLKFLARKFREDLNEGNKILVHKHHGLSAADTEALHRSVRRHGSNPILLVELAETPEQVGSVEEMGDGTFRGYVDRFAPAGNAYDFSFEAWLKLCRTLTCNLGIQARQKSEPETVDIESEKLRTINEELKVVVGKDGWLFLDNDSDQVITQYEGKLLFTQEQLEEWRAELTWRRDFFASLSIPYCLMVAPNKETVYEDALPASIRRGEVQPIDQFLSLARAILPVSYPREQLMAARNAWNVFDQVDMHWTLQGALIACEHLDKVFQHAHGVSIADFDITKHGFITYPSTGDLGNKFTPHIVSSRVSFDPALEEGYLQSENNVTNHGHIRTFFNERGNGRKCLIFGDSFGQNLARAIKEYFSCTVFCHSSLVDADLVKTERPDIVISEHVERFLIAPPGRSATFDIQKLIRAKQTGS